MLKPFDAAVNARRRRAYRVNLMRTPQILCIIVVITAYVIHFEDVRRWKKMELKKKEKSRSAAVEAFARRPFGSRPGQYIIVVFEFQCNYCGR